MCLAVPGKIMSIENVKNNDTLRVASVDFNGTSTQVSLVLTSEAKTGDYILVHAGYALQVICEKDASEIWSYLKEIT